MGVTRSTLIADVMDCIEEKGAVLPGERPCTTLWLGAAKLNAEDSLWRSKIQDGSIIYMEPPGGDGYASTAPRHLEVTKTGFGTLVKRLTSDGQLHQ